MAAVVFLDSGDMTRAALSRSMARFIEARVNEGRRVLVRVEDERKAAQWDQFLWTWDEQSFLPHSVLGTEWPGDEPVTIAARTPAATPGVVLVCLDDVPPDELLAFDEIYELVDRCSDEGLERSRRRWSAWKATGRSQEVRKDWTQAGSQ